MIHLTRISPPSTSAVLTAKEVSELLDWLDAFAARKRQQKPQACPHELDADQVQLIIPEAEAWLEKHRGVICQPGDYRLDIPHVNADRLHKQKSHPIVAFRLPVKPVHVINSALIDGQPSDGWYTRGGFLMHREFIKVNKGVRLTVEMMAGWATLPHLVALAIAVICKHWVKNPDDRKGQTLGSATHQVLQLLPLHEPSLHRGAIWL